MSEDRRSFLSKLGMGISALLTLPFTSKGSTAKAEIKKIIEEVKPMGFQWECYDPFLFCAHHEDKFPKGNAAMGPVASLSGREMGNDFIIKDGFRMYHGKQVPGFPGHPHRGFETITIVREGIVDHADSMGAAGRYGHGDVQWMTAGSGVQHAEMFPLIHQDKENPLELFQVWLNLPKKSKMVPPHFKMLWSDMLGKYTYKDINDKHTEIEIIAGKIGKLHAPTPPPDSWAADPAHDVAVWNIILEEDAEWTLPKASAGLNRVLYFYKGANIEIGGRKIPNYHMVKVASDEHLYIKNGNHKSAILMLQGKPINETVIQYGPFVMNSKQEIQQAFDDYHRTKFGGWPWPKYDHVHDRKLGRFALHADGRKETKA